MKAIISWLTRLEAAQPAATLISATGGTITRAMAVRHAYVSNAGASGTTTFTLPPAEPGLRVTAVNEANTRVLRLRPATGETVALPSTGVQGAATKGIEADAVSENVTLVCFVKGAWEAVSFAGTWTAEA